MVGGGSGDSRHGKVDKRTQQTVVLAVELSRHMEERVGFEPTEHFALRFSGPTPLAGLGHLPKLAVRTGVEPVTPG